MTESDYRTYPAYSNSDLGELFNLRMGRPIRPIPPGAALFGTTFHSLILEPEKPVDWSQHHVTDHDRLNRMADSFRAYAAKWLPDRPLPWSDVEVSRFWDCTTTGLPLKCRIDAIWRDGQRIIDLKTTSARTGQEFFDSFLQYGYDRQASFYLDSQCEGEDPYGFTFLGIQKSKPYDVFCINMDLSHDRITMVDNARQKNARLLRDAYNESLKPDGWRPSSWSRGEEVSHE